MNKLLITLITLIFIISCKSNTATMHQTKQEQHCPTDGVCSFEVLRDKQILILEDEFKKTYHKLEKTDGRVVLKFAYKRNQDPKLADDAYSEIIFVEIDEDLNELELDDQFLSQAKVSFGRLCFCRGATGFYKVKKGKLKISRYDKTFTISLEFTVNEVPQVITSFTETFEL